MHIALLCIAAASLSGVDGKRNGRKKSGNKTGGNNLGSWTAATGPMHKVICGDRACRPGEGNLKGYGHWSQPYEHFDVDKSLLKKKNAPGWTEDSFPADRYAQLIARATAVSRENVVILTAADFDFRETAENWYAFAVRAGATNALVHSLDAEAYAYFQSRGIPSSNGTTSMEAWEGSRLRRHIQRALAERHMAAAALLHSGFDVFMMDATAVLLRDPMPFFRDHAAGDLMAMRGANTRMRTWPSRPLLSTRVTGATACFVQGLAGLRVRRRAARPCSIFSSCAAASATRAAVIPHCERACWASCG